MLYGDWEDGYNRVPSLLGVMAAANPVMVHVVEPWSKDNFALHKGATARVFGGAFWEFKQCVWAFEHYRPIISVNSTFSMDNSMAYFWLQ
jgi:hypothetical protein